MNILYFESSSNSSTGKISFYVLDYGQQKMTDTEERAYPCSLLMDMLFKLSSLFSTRTFYNFSLWPPIFNYCLRLQLGQTTRRRRSLQEMYSREDAIKLSSTVTVIIDNFFVTTPQYKRIPSHLHTFFSSFLLIYFLVRFSI